MQFKHVFYKQILAKLFFEFFSAVKIKTLEQIRRILEAQSHSRKYQTQKLDYGKFHLTGGLLAF